MLVWMSVRVSSIASKPPRTWNSAPFQTQPLLLAGRRSTSSKETGKILLPPTLMPCSHLLTSLGVEVLSTVLRTYSSAYSRTSISSVFLSFTSKTSPNSASTSSRYIFLTQTHLLSSLPLLKVGKKESAGMCCQTIGKLSRLNASTALSFSLYVSASSASFILSTSFWSSSSPQSLGSGTGPREAQRPKILRSWVAGSVTGSSSSITCMPPSTNASSFSACSSFPLEVTWVRFSPERTLVSWSTVSPARPAFTLSTRVPALSGGRAEMRFSWRYISSIQESS